MKKFRKYLKKQATKIINFKKKKNEVIIIKRAARSIRKCKNILYFYKINLKINI